jgi:hypothetical protein
MVNSIITAEKGPFRTPPLGEVRVIGRAAARTTMSTGWRRRRMTWSRRNTVPTLSGKGTWQKGTIGNLLSASHNTVEGEKAGY